jgi:hypothetical protein
LSMLAAWWQSLLSTLSASITFWFWGILERILTNRTICGKNSHPDPHVNTAKVQIAAQVIKVVTFGLDTSVGCLFQCKGCSVTSLLCSNYLSWKLSFSGYRQHHSFAPSGIFIHIVWEELL